ncbi:ABATE domain-containing protein [Actinomadura barringtoniae]|uniref:ABATE domain-containing protein n=1 Tax=Actinomadura barringtoniae TaxID=1427535 RepID=A0A939PCU4_9ACTN|nr:CGNR zinc finger domain-containing protein [Actinomadura barringtoniae]MBO2450281.1 ABATE domain-containing protein [Actinomadura barringtoniae]
MVSPEAEARIKRLRFDTGAAWLDLIATVGNAYGTAPVERLSSVTRFREWLNAEDLLPESDPTEGDLARARILREALRSLALATVRLEPFPQDAVDRVNEFLTEDRTLVLATESGGLQVRRPPDGQAALGRIARQAADQLAGRSASMLRTCADPVCGLLFLDPSGRRVWCATEICGVRHRVREHRRRKASE